MKRIPYIYMIVTLLILLAGSGMECHAQRFWEKKPTKTSKTKKESKSIPFQPARASAQRDSSNVLEFIVEEGDTIYRDQIKASKVYSMLPRQKGKDWRKYYRLVHNFSKAYPYALVAKKLVTEADSVIAAQNLKGAKREKYKVIEENEALYEEFMMDDAEYCVVAFGIAARVSKNAVVAAREKGLKVGMIRPITLWPFPKKPLAAAADKVKGFVSVELSMGQMIEDVKLATECKKPVVLCNRAGGMIPSPEEVLASIEKMAGGNN